jgi:hypothetical protein
MLGYRKWIPSCCTACAAVSPVRVCRESSLRSGLASGVLALQLAQILYHGLETTHFHPAARLLTDHARRRQIVLHLPPLIACLGNGAHPLKTSSVADVVPTRALSLKQR